MNAVVYCVLAASVLIPGLSARAAQGADEAASRRMEDCLDLAAHVPIDEAVGMTCPAGARRAEGATSGIPEVTRESAALVLRRLSVADEAGMCAREQVAPESAVSALCALLSHEQYHLANAPQRRIDTDSRVPTYQPVRLSIHGIDRYVRHVLQAASAEGFSRLAAAINVVLRNDLRDNERGRRELTALQRQADYLSSAFEDKSATAGFKAVSDGYPSPGSATDNEAQALAVMASCGQLPQVARVAAEAEPALSASSIRSRTGSFTSTVGNLSLAHKTLVGSWASDAANEYRARAREAMARAGLDSGDGIAAQRTEQYVSQVMYEVTWRAGHCALACAGRALHKNGVEIPIPIQADLLVPIHITQ